MSVSAFFDEAIAFRAVLLSCTVGPVSGCDDGIKQSELTPVVEE